MTKKVQKILLIIFLTALIIALMAASFLYASTYGRYSGGALSDDSTYDDTIEFIGTERYVVRTPEELNDAIENGYSYIQIADDAEQPFVITTDVQDVSTNLVLDLNGTVVVRNSRNPMLNVSQGVSVVLVYDSSNAQSGAFYNPVGSALQVSGGTMTIGSGNYESGPRDGENNIAKGISSSITLYTREGVTEPAAVARAADDEYERLTTAATQVPYINGNYYQETGALSGYSFVTADTFLIYTREEGTIADAADSEENIAEGDLLVDDRKLTVPCNVASCDFYYYYATGERAENGTDIYAVVYGYWDVKELAEQGSSLESAGLQWPYAAIRMTAGEGFVRGGNFVNQFDVANTYGILTEENSKDGATGSLVVSETGRAGTTNFTARGEAVCIGCWEGDVAISGGNFSSELGNTIVMSGGTLNITAGNFNKNAAAGAKDGNGAAISMQDGALTIAGTQTDTKSVQFTVTGSYVNGIEAAGGTINAENFSMQLKGSHCKGIYANIANSVAEGAYDVTVSDADITVGEAVNNDGNFGIHMNNGYILCSDLTLDVYGTNSAGVLAVVENAIAGRANVVLTGTYRGTIHQSGTTELSSAAVILQGGHIDLRTDAPEQEDEYNITSDGFGIVVEGGNISQSEGSLSVNTTRGTAIYLRGGSLTQAGNATLSVTSAIADNIQWAQEEGDNSGDGTASIYNGVYVRGGSLTANGTLDVDHTGVENDATGDYRSFVIKSYAVYVSGGQSAATVDIVDGEIKNSVGGGLYVSGANTIVTLGDSENPNGDNVELSIQTTGYDRVIQSLSIPNADATWNYSLTAAGGHAVEINGGTLHVYYGSYTAVNQGDGIRIVNGTAYIHGGYFVGKDAYKVNTAGAAASYAFKVYGGSAYVYGGTFGKADSNATPQGNGAFVMDGTAYITRATIQAGGTTGFSVWKNANVTFDPEVNSNNEIDNDAIYVYGASTGLAIENGGSDPRPSLQVTINGGQFYGGTIEGQWEGNPYGIWYGNGNATLNISGGIISGRNAGLQIYENPGQIVSNYNLGSVNYSWTDNRHIKISGGRFSRIYDDVGGLRVCDILDCILERKTSGVWESNVADVTNANGISVSGAWSGDANSDVRINSSLSRGEVIVEKS